MDRPRSAAELSRRQLFRVLGGLAGAALGIRAVSADVGAAKRPKEALARYDYVHFDNIFQPYELPLPSERLKARR